MGDVTRLGDATERHLLEDGGDLKLNVVTEEKKVGPLIFSSLSCFAPPHFLYFILLGINSTQTSRCHDDEETRESSVRTRFSPLGLGTSRATVVFLPGDTVRILFSTPLCSPLPDDGGWGEKKKNPEGRVDEDGEMKERWTSG